MAIPRIGVRSTVESIAFNRPEDVHAPYQWGDVAWYDLGPRPGDIGHAVVYGHLDSLCCPAVFYYLRNLRKNDLVQVAYRTGKPLTFKVQWSNVYWNNKLPVSWLYATVHERGLVLMTCAGFFHRDGTGYDHKLLVYARLVLPNGQLG
jgi:hypothetical protein